MSNFTIQTMSMIKTWLEAFRLRTIPLSISGICMGSFLAFNSGQTNYLLFSIALLTTILFQVLSNLANDLGDSLKGTDNEHRVGPKRTVQAGKITVKQMKVAVMIMSVLSLISASLLIFFAKEEMSSNMIISYLILACFCIIAAITYTVGKKAYGYYGLGDLMVFLFFGLVGVIGSNTLYIKEIDWLVVLPATTIGCLSTAVLNLNNMRDIENDAASFKNTLVVKLGIERAKIYHVSLLAIALLTLISFSFAKHYFWMMVGCLPFLILIKHSKLVLSNSNPRELDPELKKVAITTFLVSLLSGIGLLIDSKLIL
jgi:1,4-dihydroxy-2-naphthoate octaprenyltransferase